uniref:RGS domain-containing protein n=1 Tax=Strigamia maritima TaxID=126957 RepID=T1IIJ8_STRMM
MDMYNKLKKVLVHKWEFICMQAQEQVKLAKERKKQDKIVVDSQERAYWRVHRPPVGHTSALESSPFPVYRNGTKKKKSIDDLKREIQMLQDALSHARLKSSVAIESLIHRCEIYAEYDPFISGVQPSNPWVSDDISLWVLNDDIVDYPTEKRIKRWGLSLHELLNDATGLHRFENYLRTEYSSENIRFWKAVEDLRLGSQAWIEKKVKDIFEEFLAPGASNQVNLDSKTVENTQKAMNKPNRYTFDSAQKHVFALMNKDSYPRFLRSEAYKQILANAAQPMHKKKYNQFSALEVELRKKFYSQCP